MVKFTSVALFLALAYESNGFVTKPSSSVSTMKAGPLFVATTPSDLGIDINLTTGEEEKSKSPQINLDGIAFSVRLIQNIVFVYFISEIIEYAIFLRSIFLKILLMLDWIPYYTNESKPAKFVIL